MKLFLKIFFLLATCNIIAQKSNFTIPDSLKQKSFSELNDLYYGSKLRVMDSIYANTYLQKGIAKNDSIEIAKGYLFLTAIAENSIEKEKLINNSIMFSKDKIDFLVPCTAYSIKASLCKQKKQFKEALDYYLLTHTSAEKAGNIELKHITKYNIGVLKTKIGDHKEALNYFKEYWSLYKDNQKYTKNHLATFFALSNAYTKNNKLDSASYFSTLGLKYSRIYNDENQYYLFVFLEGLNKFYEKKYNATIDSINKAVPYIKKYKDVNNLAVCYTYLGKAYAKLGNKDKSINYLIKVDSIFNEINDLLPRSREVYKIMIAHSKELNNYKDQLYYTNQLLKLDSILTDNYKYLNSTIYKKYETRQLLLDQQRLIKIHDNEKKVINKYVIVLIVVIFTITIGLLFNFYKHKNYQKKYLELTENIDKETAIEINKKSTSKIQNNSDLNNEIDQEIITKTLNNLSKFEFNKGYLDNKITLNNLAKRVGTNSRYLSKIINSYKKKSYSNYINDLRINYIVNKLRSDEKFRKYTIDVIAQEAGFNSRRSFSNVFQKKTGISTAFFINKLEEEVK